MAAILKIVSYRWSIEEFFHDANVFWGITEAGTQDVVKQRRLESVWLALYDRGTRRLGRYK